MPDVAAEIAAAIDKQIRDRLDPAVQEIGEAWAASCRTEAPALSGRLAGSISYAHKGNGEGALRMTGYGDIVAEGIPGSTVQTAAGRSVTMKSLSRKARHIRKRQGYEERVGRVVAHPNPFYERAWESSAVQDLITSLPETLAK